MAQDIGETAGKVWQCLKEKGPTTVSKMVQELKCPRDQVHRAIGWLAREDKLNFDQTNGNEKVSLK